MRTLPTARERYLHDHFGLDEDVSWEPRWNIAPTQPVVTIRQDPKTPSRQFRLSRRGLIPYWAKDASIGFKTINAVSETASEKPAFRDAMRRPPPRPCSDWLCNILNGIVALFGRLGTERGRDFHVSVHLLIICVPLFLAFPDWQQFSMTRRKSKMVNEVQALLC